MAVVIESEHVLAPAPGGVPGHRAGRRAGPVQAGGLAGPGVQLAVVRRLVQPGAPDDHAGPVAVADHHVVHVLHGDVLPCRVAYVGPAGCLLPHHQPELVAGVEEVRGLRVVRAAHHVAVQLGFQDLGVPALQPGGGRHAPVREQLVPVQPEDRQPLAVEVKAVGLESRLPEAGRDRHVMLVPGRGRSA